MECAQPICIVLLILAVVTLIVLYRRTISIYRDACYCQQEGMTGLSSAKQRNAVEGFAYVRARNGGRAYKVHEDLRDPDLAANTMDQLNATATSLIEQLVSKYIDVEYPVQSIKPKYRRIVESGIASLRKNYKAANLEENIPARSGGDTSYVIDKGDVFAMCLRDPKDNHKIDTEFNNLTFVLVHELAHIFTSTFGHDTLFWNNFKFLLQNAVEFGLYAPVDYKANGSPYCGIVVTYSPIFDDSLLEYSTS